MKTLPLSQYIFPDPEESDPDGHGLICIGADLSLPHSMKRIHMGFSHGLMKMNLFVGGALNHAVSFILKTINRVNRLFGT